MLLANENAISSGNYIISNSLRFQSASSTYGKRTPSVASNQQTWTWSGWVKRGALGSSQQIFASDNTSTSQARLHFTASDTIEFLSYISAFQIQLVTTQVFRDPSAWYHIVLKLDTTNATSSNRCMLYVNGVQVTAFSTATYPAQNYNGVVNSNLPYYLGSYYNAGSGEFLDGYLAEVNFIDGQALTPSSFGTTDPTSGQWVAAKYTGTYGTNGFYLPFSNGTSTTTLGNDSSGNGNNWTLTNFTRSAGVSDCWMKDVPSGNGSPSATQPSSNYAVLNPLLKNPSYAAPANGNLSAAMGVTAQNGTVISTMTVSSGKWYCEFTAGGANFMCGLLLNNASNLNTIVTNTLYVGQSATGYAYQGISGQKYNNAVATAYGAAFLANDVIGVAYDADAGTLVFYKNGVSQGNAFTGLSGEYFFAMSDGSATVGYANFGQRSFAYTPPTGFKALCTANLPTATILKGSTNMNAVLQVGSAVNTGANLFAQSGYTYGMAWGKDRAAVNNHQLVDTVRGTSNVLQSNTTAAETTYTAPTGTDNCVAWVWNAGTASASNTNGSITSTVSVNATAGFSVVTYTGTGANATVGHGLGVAPKMIICKNRSAVTNWLTYNANLPSNLYYLALNTTDAQSNASGATVWNSTSPTSTVFSVGTSSAVNGSTNNMVAYCFAEIAGFSKAFSYTGNGSADGPFIYLGFRPKFVMIKDITTAQSWIIYDTSRNTYNTADLQLQPNVSTAEASGATIDVVSNGIKIRSTGAGVNTSNDVYIYMAFAENPFQNSNAR